MTYLEAVNSVLVRLREPEVTGVNSTAYSRLIGELVNDGYRAVAQACEWTTLSGQAAFETTIGNSRTTLTSIKDGSTIHSVWLSAEKIKLKRQSLQYLFDQQRSDEATGKPTMWSVHGEEDGSVRLRLHPQPDQAYNIQVVHTDMPAAMTNKNDEIKVPYEPVVFHAYAHAIKERGEDQGRAYMEALDTYRRSLARHVTLNNADKGGSGQWQVL